MLLALIITLSQAAETAPLYWFLGDSKGTLIAGPLTTNPQDLCNQVKSRTDNANCISFVQGVQNRIKTQEVPAKGVLYQKGSFRIGITPDKRGDILIGGEPIGFE